MLARHSEHPEDDILNAETFRRMLFVIVFRGSDLGGGEIFCTSPGRPCGPPSLLYNGNGVVPGSKAAGRGVDHPPTSSAPNPPVDIRGLF